MKKAIGLFSLNAFLVFCLPLVGILLADKDIAPFIGIPIHFKVQQPAFAWWYFFILLSITISAVGPFIYIALTQKATPTLRFKSKPFPIWGWGALITLSCSWTMAWTRFEWFKDYQIYTFLPIWFSFIVFINALNRQRKGSCLMTREPKKFILLFFASALFWWYFEYLNRFVLNWHYLSEAKGIDLLEYFGPYWYSFWATLAFSTVLPGVLSIKEYLESFSVFTKFDQKWVFNFNEKPIGWLILLGAILGMIAIGFFPKTFYPALWLAPGLLAISVKMILGGQHIFSDAFKGNWSQIVLAASASLVCGFFWEMWNFWSDAKWVYEVPYVSRFYIFEMPLIGFAGYIPFGLECLIASQGMGGRKTNT